MMMLKLRPVSRHRPARNASTRRPASSWEPIASNDCDMAPVRYRRDSATILSSLALYAFGFAATGALSIFFSTPPGPGASLVTVIGAYILAALLMGWVPLFAFVLALRPLFEARRIERQANVVRGLIVAEDPDELKGELGVNPPSSFAIAHAGRLIMCVVAVALSLGYLVSLVVYGLVIEGHVVQGTLGAMSTMFVGTMMLLTIAAGVTLPLHWWRSHSMMSRLAEDEHHEGASVLNGRGDQNAASLCFQKSGSTPRSLQGKPAQGF